MCSSASSGDFDNLPGMLQSFDAETGKHAVDVLQHAAAGHARFEQRRRHRRTDVDDRHLRSGSRTWCIVGTGNPTPVLNGAVRPGDNPWTCSIVALNPDTGKLAWGFQASPHDTHDWDAAEVPVLVDGDFNGAPRKMLMQASRNGYFFVLDRTNGKNLLTDAVRRGELGEGHRRGRPSDSRSGEGAGARRRADRARTKAARPTTARRASIRRPACSSSARRTPTASTSSSRSTARTAGRARTTASRARACCARSTTRPGRSAGTTTSATAHRRAGVLTTDIRPDVHAATPPATRSRCAPATARRCGTPASAASATRRSPTSSTAGSTCSWEGVGALRLDAPG